MHLRMVDARGQKTIVPLDWDSSITLGRSDKADMMINDVDASRIHAGVKYWDGEYVVKDLKSRNGTLLNGKAIEVAVLKSGDVIRIGETDIIIEDKEPKGPNTIIRRIGEEMAKGKGYRTIMLETVKETDKKPTKKK